MELTERDPKHYASRRAILGRGLALAGGVVALDAFAGVEEASASTITGYYNVMDSPYGAAGDGVTDDTVAIQDALDDAGIAGGGVVYLPPGVYRVETATSSLFLNVPNNVTVMGAGAFSTTIKGPEGWDDAAYLLKLSGARSEVRDLTLEMPDEFEREGGVYIRGVQLTDNTIIAYLNRVEFHNLTYGVVGWPGTDQVISCVDCRFDAPDVSTDHGAMGILANGAPGSQVLVRGCRFESLGSDSTPNQAHAIYLSHTTSLHAEGCYFADHHEGRYIQFNGDDYVESGNASFAVISKLRIRRAGDVHDRRRRHPHVCNDSDAHLRLPFRCPAARDLYERTNDDCELRLHGGRRRRLLSN